jgi:hypothetical protein
VKTHASCHSFAFNQQTLAQQIITCPGGDYFTITGDELYFVARTPSNRAAAKLTCQQKKMELATLYSTAQAPLVHSSYKTAMAGTIANYWIGLYKLSGNSKWVWDDGFTWADGYLPWQQGKPADGELKQCVEVLAADGRISNADCSLTKPAVCVRPSEWCAHTRIYCASLSQRFRLDKALNAAGACALFTFDENAPVDDVMCQLHVWRTAGCVTGASSNNNFERDKFNTLVRLKMSMDNAAKAADFPGQVSCYGEGRAVRDWNQVSMTLQ